MVAELHGVKLYKVNAHLENGVSLKTLVERPWADPIRHWTSDKVVWHDEGRGVEWTWGFIFYLISKYDNDRFVLTQRSSLRAFVRKHIREHGSASAGIRRWYEEYILPFGEPYSDHVKKAYERYQAGDSKLPQKSAWDNMHITQEDLFNQSVKRTRMYPKLIHHLPEDKITEMVLLVCRRAKQGEPYDE
ncbi:MAG: hypothetical protein HXM21_00600 [Haemophilus influenzae]|nr:hypothetical protein [Haemophilus influenzae]